MTDGASRFRRLRRAGTMRFTFAASHRGWALYTRAYLRPQFAALGPGTVIRGPRLIAGPGGIELGKDGFIREGVRLEVVDRPGEAPARLIIGDRVNLEQNVHITAAERTTLGDDVCLAANVVIAGAAHPDGRPGGGNRARAVLAGPSSIEIGDRVFIGANSVVLPNVRIGANSVIGAGSVVTRDVPPDVIAAGTPAKVMRRIDE